MFFLVSFLLFAHLFSTSFLIFSISATLSTLLLISALIIVITVIPFLESVIILPILFEHVIGDITIIHVPNMHRTKATSHRTVCGKVVAIYIRRRVAR